MIPTDTSYFSCFLFSSFKCYFICILAMKRNKITLRKYCKKQYDPEGYKISDEIFLMQKDS